MRSSVVCLPKGVLTSLSLTADLAVVRATVIYEKAVDLEDGGNVCWVFWHIRRVRTRDGQPAWSARAFPAPAHTGAGLALRVLAGQDELTAHQFKGLATALGIWGAMRRPPMLEKAGLFNLQATSETLDFTLGELLEHGSHFGLSERAAATGWNVGP
jgi:hypothetical protein